ncbi:hypothetical protein D1007_49173 [Hordeum vulgare]|nr:hypothetical protein D1007_49173 [Hordeum vulgare]
MFLELLSDWDIPYSWGSAALSYLYRQTEKEWYDLVSEDPSAAEGYHAFNMAVREVKGGQVDYAPMHDELGRELLMCVNNANVALIHPHGGGLSERTLRITMEKFRTRFHKMAAMLSCHDAKSVDMFTAGTSRSSRARCRYIYNKEIEEEDAQEEELTQEEQAQQEHEYDIDAPQLSQPSNTAQPKKGIDKTPHGPRKMKCNNWLNSLEYPHKLLPKGMTR